MAGKDRGKRGAVLRAFPQKDLIVVAGVAMQTKHVKRTQQKAGEIIVREAPIHVSNVMIFDTQANKPSRIGYEVKGNGKVRVARASKVALEQENGSRKK